MDFIQYTLPEFVFFNGNSPEGDTLKGRTVIMHVRTDTAMEVIAMDEVFISDFKGSQFEFTYLNFAKVAEKFLIVVHFSRLEDEEDLQEVMKKTSLWYTHHLQWEDNNIISEIKANDN